MKYLLCDSVQNVHTFTGDLDRDNRTFQTKETIEKVSQKGIRYFPLKDHISHLAINIPYKGNSFSGYGIDFLERVFREIFVVYSFI